MENRRKNNEMSKTKLLRTIILEIVAGLHTSIYEDVIFTTSLSRREWTWSTFSDSSGGGQAAMLRISDWSTQFMRVILLGLPLVRTNTRSVQL